MSRKLAVLLILVAVLLGGCAGMGGMRLPAPQGMIGAFYPEDLPPSPVPGLPPVFQPGVWTLEVHMHPDVMTIALAITPSGQVIVMNGGARIPFSIKDGRIYLSNASLFSRPEKNSLGRTIVGICVDLDGYGLAGQMFRKRHPGEIPPPK